MQWVFAYVFDDHNACVNGFIRGLMLIVQGSIQGVFLCFVEYLYMHTYTYHIFIHIHLFSAIHLEHGSQSRHAVGLLDYVPGTLLKLPIPKSSQASYLPESHAIHDHYFAVARCWSSIVGFAVWEVACLRADFSASDVVYVTDGLVSSVFATMQHSVCHVCGS